MSAWRTDRAAAWLPTALVLVLVLAAGGRLVDLSVRAHAEQTRLEAQRLATRGATSIERTLERLAEQTRAAAAGTSGANTFSMGSDGSVNAGKVDPALARTLATEWASVRPPAPGQSLLGPLREGSEWIVAARAPVSGEDPPRGWLVSYAPLEQLLAGSSLTRIASEGFEFALLQSDADGSAPRALLASRNALWGDAMTHPIRAPSGFAFVHGSGALQIAIQPRAGWYPMRDLATDVGLLALVAWLLAFAAHDLMHRTQRLRDALDSAHDQLQAAQRDLTREIEQRETLQRTFEHARYHDAFTGLPNRRYFMDQLDRALRELRTGRRKRLSVVLIDIDRFQIINETLGHTAGDELMVQVARRFERATAENACVLARWGGDQFAVLMLDVASSGAALALAGALQRSLVEPFELRRHRLSVTARLGVTCVEPGPQRAEDVVREADIALSVAKRQEDATCVLYTPAMGGDVATLVSLEADLHLALERNELKLLFQPIVALASRRMVGAEALLRWRHPIEGLLRPDRFLPIAEEAGLMIPVTRWTVRRVLKLAGEWRRRLPPDHNFYLSVNLSASALRDPELSAYVATLLEETHVAPATLKFELTEGGLISNVGGAREMLERLHAMGIELMLDDFGTGYSSLNYLQLFPFDYIKIDRPLLPKPGEPVTHGGLTSAMVHMAASLGLTSIAEVVETQGAAQALQQMGCQYGQGYFFCEPIEAEEALQCLRGNGRLAGWAAQPPAPSPPEWQDDSQTLILPAIVEGTGENPSD